MKMKKRDYVLVVGSISFLILITSITLLLGDHLKPKSCGCPSVISHNFLWLFIVLAVVFVGSLIYYLFSFKMDEKERIIGKNLEIIYSILDKDEKKVLEAIVKNSGEIEQAEVSKNYDKIRAHRILKKLQDKGIIGILKKGKTNTIELNEELKKELMK
jgi:hypothetical protein